MKALLFLLLPFFMFAQNPYPDTLTMQNNKLYPCRITGLNESKVNFIYSKNVSETAVLAAVKEIYLENHGKVYLRDIGMKGELKTLSSYIENRNEQIKKEQFISDEQDRIEMSAKLIPGETMQNIQTINVQKNISQDDYNRWSFGINYFPYYSGKIYTLVYSRNQYPPYYEYPPNLYHTTNNEISMEAQLAFHPIQQLAITFDVGYQSTYYEIKNEEHVRRDSFGINSDYGSISTEGLKLFDFTLGVKYYFKEFLFENVSVFVLAGIGKQYAWAEIESKNLFREPTPGYSSNNNNAEFMEDLNSPIHYNFGFGAEYFFNQSLSLTSSIKFLYSKTSATYNSVNISPNERWNYSIERKNSEVQTRVGLGLNFYF